MKEQAEKQMSSISIDQIKEVLKKNDPGNFDKMIISEGQNIKRSNYIFARLKFDKVERDAELIKFPLYAPVENNFADIEGGQAKHGDKAVISSDNIFDTLKNSYQIKGGSFEVGNISEAFVYKLDEFDGEISKTQKKYYFPDLTYRETCNECHGEKYITCDDYECEGRHNYDCPECHTEGKVTCNPCSGEGENTCRDCSGDGMVKCGSMLGSGLVGGGFGSSMAGCNGKGVIYVDGGNYAKGGKKPKKEKKCSKCRGKGEVPCKPCGKKGVIKCNKCKGRGEVTCSKCSGKGDITCSKCYGDKKRYGLIDCPTCDTIGTVAQVVYVNSHVSNNSIEKIILKGEKLNISDSNIEKHVKSSSDETLVYKKVNDIVEQNYDEYSEEYANMLEENLGLDKNNFPLVIKEEMYYQVVPCVELSYKHMLTNTSHEFTIVNFFDDPEIIFHSQPEVLGQSAGNITKSVGGFFGKIFKTKKYKAKEDKKNEITLLIYLAKADGKIEEEEKISLSEDIQNLDDFLNSEKQILFDLMNSASLPELTKKEVTFSTKERGAEVLEKITNLANADGEMAQDEKILIDKIKSMI